MRFGFYLPYIMLCVVTSVKIEETRLGTMGELATLLYHARDIKSLSLYDISILWQPLELSTRKEEVPR
jgi:hypothetical protein